ncbi:hypothetical protein MRB53_041989 [Persea americana]|nr:hypothetical protein MRB53_041989 [Persea americana]
MVLYAPLAILFINVISHSTSRVQISYATVATSVAAYLGIPLAAAILTRMAVRRLASPKWYEEKFLKYLAPWSLIGLLYTILVLFASEGSQVVDQIISVLRVAAPLVVYFIVIFGVTLAVTLRSGFGYRLCATQSFTAASNNFELAIAVAVATYGANGHQALAATVGPLIEVPVLLGLVYATSSLVGTCLPLARVSHLRLVCKRTGTPSIQMKGPEHAQTLPCHIASAVAPMAARRQPGGVCVDHDACGCEATRLPCRSCLDRFRKSLLILAPRYEAS